MKTVQICEYDSLIAGSENGLHKDGYVTLKRDAFALLERFLLTEQGKEDAPELMHISRRRGVGDVITAKNTGVPCLSVLWGFRNEAEIRKNGGEYFCHDPKDLAQTLKNMVKEIYGQ